MIYAVVKDEWDIKIFPKSKREQTVVFLTEDKTIGELYCDIKHTWSVEYKCIELDNLKLKDIIQTLYEAYTVKGLTPKGYVTGSPFIDWEDIKCIIPLPFENEGRIKDEKYNMILEMELWTENDNDKEGICNDDDYGLHLCIPGATVNREDFRKGFMELSEEVRLLNGLNYEKYELNYIIEGYSEHSELSKYFKAFGLGNKVRS